MRYSDVSYWLSTAGDLTPRAALRGAHDADVAIVGAGYTGLWTAWYLLQRRPDLRVAICESEIAGFGASGRNGAWCSAGIGLTPTGLARRYDPATARAVVRAMRDTVDEIGRVCDTAGIDAEFRRGGMLRVARGPHEVAAMRASAEGYRALALDDGMCELSADELASRVRIAGARGAVYDPRCATVHPGHLVRGLASAVEHRGAQLFERTRVTRIDPVGRRPRSPAVVHTRRGRVRAGAVVVATEAWTAQLPGHRRSLLPIYSLIVLTAPLSPAQWDEIGWAGHECLSSHRLTVDYLSRTADGRILFGGRGAPYHFGSRVRPRFDRHRATHAALRAMVGNWFPALADVAITHQWGGPLGMPRDWLPNFTYDPATGLAGAWGYTGQGVGASNLAGRTLADLITGQSTPLTRLPMAGHRSRRWEPEPLRWLGARYIQRAFGRLDRRAERGGRPPRGRSLAERLMRH
ncbi:MAG: FAD-binding oxidoreductase [Actinobacteria bacterium]|nr:FAD-binding oxidoreductase [Actinomycetota bacterium]